MTTPAPGLIELRLNNVGQLFNTMDPSPFHERDLDHDAEEFILSWAREHEKDSDLRIRIVLRQPEDAESARLVRESIQHYFTYRARIARHDLGELFRPALEEFAAAVTSKPRHSPSFPANLLNAWPLSSAGGSLVWAPELGPRMLEEATARFGAVFEQVLVRLESRLASQQYAAPKAALANNTERAAVPAARSWQKLHPSELRALLSAFGLSTAGDKEALVARLTERLVLQEASAGHRVDAAQRLRSCASSLEQWQSQGRCLLESTTSTLRAVEQSLLQTTQELSGEDSMHPAAAPKRRRGSSQRTRGAAGSTEQSQRDEAMTAAACT